MGHVISWSSTPTPQHHQSNKIMITEDEKWMALAIKEAQKLGIPIIAITDTNADPDGIDYVIPGNDDSLKSLQLFVKTVAEAVIAGKSRHQSEKPEDDKALSSAKEGTIFDKEGHSIK
ncbi:MAG: 30S ribosomal protein S2, partial [Lentisphaeraceae bacterium]|nr:30S ribosomal protein S2 [Lentisphaeraceae bacterium]